MKKILIILFMTLLTTTTVLAADSNTEAMLQYNQGIDFFKIGQYDEAIGAFRQAIKLDPNYVDAYYNLGAVLEYLQQYDAALTVFKQIIVRKPDDYDSVYKAAWLSSKLGDSQKAKTYLTLIPAYSARAQDAKILADQLDFSISPQTKSIEPNLIGKNKVSQTNELYDNIPTPTGITSDSDGNVYVAEFSTNTILKITTDNDKMVYMKNPKINGPIGLAMDDSKNLYVANYNADNILKISPYGEITSLISNVKKPYCLYISGRILFVSCQGTDSVLKYKLPN